MPGLHGRPANAAHRGRLALPLPTRSIGLASAVRPAGLRPRGQTPRGRARRPCRAARAKRRPFAPPAAHTRPPARCPRRAKAPASREPAAAPGHGGVPIGRNRVSARQSVRQIVENSTCGLSGRGLSHHRFIRRGRKRLRREWAEGVGGGSERPAPQAERRPALRGGVAREAVVGRSVREWRCLSRARCRGRAPVTRGWSLAPRWCAQIKGPRPGVCCRGLRDDAPLERAIQCGRGRSRQEVPPPFDPNGCGNWHFPIDTAARRVTVRTLREPGPSHYLILPLVSGRRRWAAEWVRTRR